MVLGKLPKKWLKDGIGIRLEKTSFNSRYGYRVHRTDNPANNKVWPGEIGTLSRRTVRGVDWEQLVIEAHFSHGRVFTLAEMRTSDGEYTSTDGEWFVGFTLGDRIDDFTPVKEKNNA